jgi:hypothetical protein
VILFRRRIGARYKLRYIDATDARSRDVSLDGYGVLIANSDRCGESFHLSPASRVDDGVFELPGRLPAKSPAAWATSCRPALGMRRGPCWRPATPSSR